MIRLLFLLLCIPSVAFAQDTPTDYIRANVDQVIVVLADKQYSGETGKEQQLKRISSIVDTFFDATELSKRALAQYWKTFSEPQRAEFEVLFLRLIKQVYLKKSLTYNNEVVVFNQEIIKSDTLADVYTTLTSPSLSLPIVYALIKRDNGWKVYDVTVENISLVKNYRSQFASILQNSTPDQLITILRTKTDE